MRMWKVVLILVLVVPRVLRMAWPEVWLEDADYMHAGLLISRGFLPYRDFVCPHFPLLEVLLGFVYFVFGSSIRAAEVLTQVAVAATALVLFLVVSPRRGRAYGILAAGIYGFSSLIFRYHLFEREIFTNLTGVCLIASALSANLGGRKRLAGVIGFSCLSLFTKLTAGWEVLAVLIFMILIRREVKETVIAVGGILAVMVAGSLAAFLVFGDRFLLQVLIFHFFKGARGNPWKNLLLIRRWLDLTGTLGFAGLLTRWVSVRVRERKWDELDSLMVLWLVVPLSYYLFLSPTFWEHNLIPMLIPLSCFSPEAVLGVWNLLRGGVGRRIGVANVTALVAIVIGSQVFPIKNNQWKLDSVYGFGFRDRSEIRRAADAVRAESGPNDVIIAPPEVAVEAGRRKLVHYRETVGPMREVERIWSSEGFAGLRRESRKEDFFRRLAELAPAGGEEALRSIKGEGNSTERVRVVVPDSIKSLLSEFRILPDVLVPAGFVPVYKGEFYTVWSLRRAVRSAPAK